MSLPLTNPVSAAGGQELEEPAFVSRIRAGDAAAFELLFRAHHPGLCAFATRLLDGGRRDIAEELVQEVFLYVWRHREGWEVRTSARSYLYSAVRHAALAQSRHERVVRRYTAETISLFDRPPRRTDADLTAEESARMIAAAIARLPERCRMVFTLTRQQGLSYAEAADVMGISVKTVDVQMGRALKALRKQLGTYWP
jgi:RNA polymerase sigma-70 factor (ECF subfamily)